MTIISCFYIKYNREPINFTFISFKKYIKVIVNHRSIILEKARFAGNKEMVQVYTLSLICSKNTSKIYTSSSFTNNKGKYIYGVKSIKYIRDLKFANDYEFFELTKSSTKNPLNMIEPKRESGEKKIRKLEKYICQYLYAYVPLPVYMMISEYYTRETTEEFKICDKYKKYNLKITLLLCVNRCMGYDVYSHMRGILN